MCDPLIGFFSREKDLVVINDGVLLEGEKITGMKLSELLGRIWRSTAIITTTTIWLSAAHGDGVYLTTRPV